MSAGKETALIGTILELIALRNGLATRTNAGMAFREDREGKRYPVRAAEAGTADIIACYREKYIEIEAKIWPNKPTMSQLERGLRVERAGGIYVVAYDVETVERLLDKIDMEKAQK